ncbi:MAG: DEAD/DEAH box helicase [Hyphobacterium sp.]|nr:MAG: DEAD/DEAH box helicase [Hyphobacterium sp.]
MTTHSRIAPALARALEGKGYTNLTEVQQAVLTDEADGADLLVSAQTGSGKTVAFGIAIAPTLLKDEERFDYAAAPLALVVAPTRELALQVQRELLWLYGEAGARIVSCVGGMDARSERKALERGCHIVVGTPGRLRDHIERRSLDMSSLRAVVLDEADEMLDFGFREDLEFILEGAPEDRRTLLFSATVPKSIADIARRYQRDAVRLSTVSERQQHADIEYRALSVSPSDRENALINVLRFYEAERAIVFCATREGVNRLSARLGNRGFAAVALSGELSQKERTHALQALRDGRARVCIATDVAARGLDLPGLELVVHSDLPTNSDVLKHRSGRTGRAGQQGVCVMIVPQNQRGRMNRLLRGAHIEAQWGEAPSLNDIKEKDRERLLNDPSLHETYDDDVLAEARELLTLHSAEQIAAAFLNRMQSTTPSAEDLMEMPAANERSKPARREPFVGGAWFKLTAGRNQRAEPRWLLPLICRIGDVTRKEVGAIEIETNETLFEIEAAHAERFQAAVAKSGGGEGTIYITPANAPSGKPKERVREERPKRKFDRKPETRTERPQPDRSAQPYQDKPFRKPRNERADERPASPRASQYNPDDGPPRRPHEQAEPAASDNHPRKAFGGKPKFRDDGDKSKRSFAGKPGPKKKANDGDSRPFGAKIQPAPGKDAPKGQFKGKGKPKPRRANYDDGNASFKRVKRNGPNKGRS